MNYGLGGQAVRYVKNCLNGWSQRVVISVMRFIWSPVITSVHTEVNTGSYSDISSFYEVLMTVLL